MSESYTVLQRCHDGYTEVDVLDFGDGYKLSIIQRKPRRPSERTTWKAVLWEREWGNKVWESTSFAKEVVMGAARRAKELRRALIESRLPDYSI